MLYKIIDTEDKKKQLAAKRRELSKAKKRIAEIDTLIQKICDTRAAPGHLPYIMTMEKIENIRSLMDMTHS